MGFPCAALLSQPSASEQRLAARLDLYADETALRSRLRFGMAGPSYFALLLDEEERGSRLVGALDIEARSSAFDSSRLVVGPGSASGALRLLVDPAYLSTGLDGADCVELDSSLSSGTAVLGLEAGPFSAFALERGAGAGIVFPRSGSLTCEAELPSPPEAAAAGMGFSLPWGGGTLCAFTSLSLRAGRAGAEAWKPDPAPDSAGLVFDLGVVRIRRWDSGWVAMGLAGSQGRIEGPGLAARIEAEERRGVLGFRAAAGAVGSGFRDLYGSRPLYELGAAADLRLALRRAATLTLGFRLKSKATAGGVALTAADTGEALDASAAASSWDSELAQRSARVSLLAPLPRYGRTVDLSWALERGADAATAVLLDIGLSVSERLPSGLWHCRWGGELRFGGDRGPGFDGLSFSLSAGRSPPAGSSGPFIDMTFGLELLEGGMSYSPAIADLGIDLWLPLRDSSRLGLGLDAPSSGLFLDRLEAGPGDGPKLSLSYRCTF
ncbi:MAG: hypothetical protein ACLQMF_13370 [Rectinemataceae bacterium]